MCSENFIEKIWYSGKYLVYLYSTHCIIEINYELTTNRKKI